MAAAKSLMELRAVFCQTGAGSVGVRYACCPEPLFARTVALTSAFCVPQRFLCQKLYVIEERKPEAANPAA